MKISLTFSDGKVYRMGGEFLVLIDKITPENDAEKIMYEEKAKYYQQKGMS